MYRGQLIEIVGGLVTRPYIPTQGGVYIGQNGPGDWAIELCGGGPYFKTSIEFTTPKL